MNTDKTIFTGLLLTVLLIGDTISIAEETDRPDNLTL